MTQDHTAKVYRPVLESALEQALHYLNGLDDMPVAATVTTDDLRQRLGRSLSEEGLDATEVIADLVADTRGGLVGSAGGRFFAWVIGGSLPAALAADWLTSAWDQNAGILATSPAEGVIEEVVGTWLKDLLGLPVDASFALVTGCQMAHVTCLAAARDAVLARQGWDVEEAGLIGAPPLRILSGNERHGSTERAIRLLGLGRQSVVDLPVDGGGRLTADTLRDALSHSPGDGTSPTIVLLQAGELNTGAYDPFLELIPIAHAAGAWVHVDGAFGLWAAASPRYRLLLAGVEQADSWATDGHKWLNVPYDCGYAFVSDQRAHQAAMSYRASYLVHNESARDQMDWNPEWSRRGRGVATYAAIRQLGREGIADLVERTCGYTHELVTRIGMLPGAEMVKEPLINQGLVRFLDTSPGAGPTDHDRRTDGIIAAIVRSGEAYFGGVTWHGRRCMRVSVCNWRTSRTDVDRAVAAVQRALAHDGN
jgi:glutamate/tyrosine decarboxylase-like PLP-dependent enzyme